jgi:hypothetical protein
VTESRIQPAVSIKSPRRLWPSERPRRLKRKVTGHWDGQTANAPLRNGKRSKADATKNLVMGRAQGLGWAERDSEAKTTETGVVMTRAERLGVACLRPSDGEAKVFVGSGPFGPFGVKVREAWAGSLVAFQSAGSAVFRP